MLRAFSYLLVLSVGLFAITSFATAQQPTATQPPPAEASLRAMPLADNDNVSITMGDITDKRTTGQFFAQLEVELKTQGATLAQAYGATKPILTAAVDDTGLSLVKPDKQPDPLFWSFEVFDKQRTSASGRLEMQNPARKATSFSFMGYVNVLNPSLDPQSVYIVKDLASQAGKPLLPEAYQKTGMELTVLTKALADKMKTEQTAAAAAKKPDPQNLGKEIGNAFEKAFSSLFAGFTSMGDNDLLFTVKDPQQQIAYLEVTDATGVPLKTSGGRSMSKDGDKIKYTASFETPLPPTAQLRIYFVTPKSVRHVPFKFESVRLP